MLRAHGRSRRAHAGRSSSEAQAERLAFSRDDRRFLAPHFVEMVLAGLGPPRPARIETTLDAALQADVAGIIETHRAALIAHGAANVAVVVLDNARGEWLAWEGSGDYFDAAHGGAINGPSVPRQPGSALKPFTYALAFEQGFTPASVLRRRPARAFRPREPGVVYSPRNYDGRYRGPLLARRALAGSENVPAVVAGVGPRRAGPAAVPATRRLHDLRPDRGVLRPRPHARQRRGQARRARGGVRRHSRAAASGAGRPI